MSNSILNIGLAGCGHLGLIHCKILSEITEQNPYYNFKGVYDIDTEKSSKAANEYNVNAYGSLNELLSEINTMIIVTPTSTHFEIAERAVKKHINVFIEKPVTTSLDEAQKLIGISENTDVKIQVGHVERFNPALTSLEKYELKPRFIESHRLAQFNPRGTDVSVIQDLMIHDIDIILNLVKSPIEKIDANGVAVISNAIDIANARLSFQNGCVANVTSSRISMKKMRKMRLFQGNTYISIDFLNNKSEVFRLTDISNNEPGISFPFSDDKKIIFEQPHADTAKESNPIKRELESFLASIINNQPVKVSLEDGKQAVKVADEIINIISKTSK
jgi:predicted dehydrogenase